MTDFDTTEFAAKVAIDSLERSANAFAKSVNFAKQKLSVAMGAGFKKYRESSRDRYGFVKTLLHRDKPIHLKNLYVQTFYQNEGDVYSDEQILSKITKPCRILIQGTAGGGKSIFLRYVNLVTSTAQADVLPLFFEMKSLNIDPSKSLVSSLSDSIRAYLPDIDEESFLNLLDDGRIILILDGFDEINFDHREEYIRQLGEISRRHPTARIIASSRPDDSIESIETFHTYRVVPFNKNQTIELLRKLPYDVVVKARFISAVDEELYEKHQAFLSNPLLITMMLMTYQQFAEIPNKVHIFYQQAFFTLFSLHDSSKEVYKRKSYSNLPIDEFQRIFACFCALTYAKQTFAFSDDSVRERIREAIKTELLDVKVDDFLRDLLESTCLLQKDGLDIVFAHRSFQEYFTAWYIVRMEAKNAKKALDAVVKRVEADLVLPMAFEMNPALIEKAWVLPTVDAVQEKLKKTQEGGNIYVSLGLFFGHIYQMEEGRLWLMYNVPKLWANRLRALHKIYDRGIPKLNQDKTSSGLNALRQRLLSDEAFARSGTGIAPTVLARFKADPKAGLSFHVPAMDKKMEEYIDVRPWMRAIEEWLPNLREAVASRVGDRRSSMDQMFRTLPR